MAQEFRDYCQSYFTWPYCYSFHEWSTSFPGRACIPSFEPCPAPLLFIGQWPRQKWEKVLSTIYRDLIKEEPTIFWHWGWELGVCYFQACLSICPPSQISESNFYFFYVRAQFWLATCWSCEYELFWNSDTYNQVVSLVFSIVCPLAVEDEDLRRDCHRCFFHPLCW